MTRRPAAAVLLAALGATGCAAGSLSPEEQAARCSDFADAVSKAALTSTPSEQVARDVANSLDNRLSRLGSPAIHDAGVKVHQDLHAVEVAQKRGDQERADKAAAQGREHVAQLAKACDLPVERFLEPK